MHVFDLTPAVRISTLAALLVASVGCQQSGKPDNSAAIAEHRERLLLTAEPADAQTPLDLREAAEGFEAGPVVLVGQIGGMPNPWAGVEKNFPWVNGEATFFLVDPATAAEFADHAPEDPDHAANCPFCARAAQQSVDAMATVTFLDATGEPIAITASELFDVDAEDVVVIQGNARLLAEKQLFVEAEGIYIRR
ncbi:MAG: hypothetical protein AAF596_06370 [Planctomycetota bacterium]